MASKEESQLRAESFRGHLLSPPDFDIKTGSYSWRVHLDAFAEKSSFFKALKETSFEEAKTASVTLHDESPTLIARFIIWVYYGEFQVYQFDAVVDTPLTSVDTLLMAGLQEDQDQNQAMHHEEPIQDLESIEDTSQIIDEAHFDALTASRSRFAPGFSPSQSEALRRLALKLDLAMYVLADKYGCPDLREYCVGKVMDSLRFRFPSVWAIVDKVQELEVDTTDLRDQIRDFFKINYMVFLKDERFKQQVKNDPELAWELIDKLGQR